MPKAFEYENGELVDSYDLGEAECLFCGNPVIGHFKSGELVIPQLSHLLLPFFTLLVRFLDGFPTFAPTGSSAFNRNCRLFIL